MQQREPTLSDEQSLTAGDKSVFLALATDPPSVLLAASKDSGVNAGEVLKKALTEVGGRGGGNALMAPLFG